MSTTSAAAPSLASPTFDARFAKSFVIACAAVPGALLLWDALHGALGVNEVNFSIRTTGLVGLILLTLSLAVTPLRRATGWSWLVGVRRNLGVYGFLYIAAHFAIFFVWDRAASVSSTLEEVLTRVYLWFGTAALVLMVPLAITSTDGMVTRLGARRWKLLHRLAYVIVALGAVHYLLLVKADISQPVVFLGLFGGLMVVRGLVRHYDLGRDLRAAQHQLAASRTAGQARPRPFWTGQLRVARIFQETPDVKTFRLMALDDGQIPFQHTAGQYLTVSLDIGGSRVNRSYTIASSPTRRAYVEITVKRAPSGYASHHLHDTVREGDALRISAPAGRFVFEGREARRVVLIAGGVGITPMMSVVRSLTDRCWPGEVYLLFAVRTRRDIVFERELQGLQERFPGLRVLVTLSQDDGPGWEGARGTITRDLITGFVPDLRRGPVMLCGPGPMMKAMRELLVGMGLPDAEVLEEAFVSPKAAVPGEGAPAAPEGQAPTAPVQARFIRSDRQVEVAPGATLLEAAEEAGLALPFECRSGICGQCKTRLVSGAVAMGTQDALTAKDRAQGWILACQARPTGDVELEA